MKLVMLLVIIFWLLVSLWVKLAFCSIDYVHVMGDDNATFPINLNAIAMIESSGGKFLIAEKENELSYGKWQISKDVLADYNTKHNTKYAPIDLFNHEINRKIAIWYLGLELPRLLRHYNQTISKESILQAYNVGARGYANGKRNKTYLEKYQRYADGSVFKYEGAR